MRGEGAHRGGKVSRFIQRSKSKIAPTARTRSANLARQPIDHAAIADVFEFEPNELKVDGQMSLPRRYIESRGQKILGTLEGAGKPDHADRRNRARRRLADYTMHARMRLA